MFRVFLLVSLVSIVFASAMNRKLGYHSPPIPPGMVLSEAQWFKTQKLDHFSDSDKRMWQQRYFVNDTLWDRQKGPVFLMLGGEGPADPAWLAIDTEIMINAAKYKAIVILLEHRYYGESHPTTNTSVSNLAFLSSRQALGDVDNFKRYIVSQLNMTYHNKWISFGGSYSGALSGWLRMYYPQTVAGAVATSGPVQAKLNFYQYLEVVATSLATTEKGIQCLQEIGNATYILDAALANKETWPMVEKMFNLSSPLTNQNDVALLASTLAGIFMEIVQYNNIPFNHITIDDLCNVMTNASLGSSLERYAIVSSVIGTIDVNFSAQVESMREISWNSLAVQDGIRQWIYQTCTEFGYYQTTDSVKQPFGDLITLSYYLNMCYKVYGILPSTVSSSVAATNKYYGGKDNIPHNATNIVFPNGSIDPWHALGVLESPHDSLVAVFINGTAHCANMYPPSPNDLPDLVKARAIITDNIQVWLV